MERYFLKGFSLIELAIMIVVVSIIIAAIYTGAGIADTAKLNTIISDLNGYKVAYDKFNEIYSAVPGDMSTASTVLGSDAEDGDGDSLIEQTGNEFLKAPEHLAMAKLIDGKYSGLSVSTSIVLGENVPLGPQEGSGFTYVQYSSWSWSDSDSQFKDANAVVYVRPNATTSTLVSLLTAKEAYGIDMKMDDGNAIRGVLTAGGREYAGSSAIRCHPAGSGTYNIQYTTLVCHIAYFMYKY